MAACPQAFAIVVALWLFGFSFAGATALGRGQAPAQGVPAPTGLIVGQVLDGDSGRPVSDFVVSLTIVGGTAQTPAGRGGGVRVITDGQGRFFFRGVARGTYLINAQKPGYLTGFYGRLASRGAPGSINLADGERYLDARILVWKQAAVTGRVVDEAGEPVVGATVRALRSALISGRPGLSSAGTATTDDRGIYRIGSLAPDRYVIVVPSTSTTIPAAMVDDLFRSTGATRAELEQAIFGATSTLSSPGAAPNQRIGDLVFQAQGRVAVPPVVGADGSMAAYVTVFYSQALLPQAAGSIVLTSGEARSGIDFQLRSLPTVRVSGRITGPDGPVGNLALRLVRPGADRFFTSFDLEVATTVADAGGAFTFLGVPPGQFVIRVLKLPSSSETRPAQMTVIQTPSGTTSRGVVVGDAPPPPRRPTLWADQEIAVGDRDISGLRVALQTGFRVSGRLEFEGASAHPPAQRLSPFLETSDHWLSAALAEMTIGADATFVSYEAPPGAYRLTIPTPAGWSVKGAMAGGKDLSDLPFDLKEDITGVVITLTDRGAGITGAVRDERSAPDATATVLVIPTDPRHWIDYSAYARRIKDVRSRRDGGYGVADLPPGEYFVAALAQSSVDWSMPGFFEAVSRVATRVMLTDGEQRSLDLRTVQLPRLPR
jgi:protocatechuate 3,4-dioxygenase beta subunit